MTEAVEGFLSDRQLDGRDAVLGALARALAAKIDQACESSATRDSSALPPLTRRLLDVTAELAERGEIGNRADRVERMLRPLRSVG